MGIIGGFCPGRFNVVRRSGDAINFEAGHCKLSVRLSADGDLTAVADSLSKVEGVEQVTTADGTLDLTVRDARQALPRIFAATSIARDEIAKTMSSVCWLR